MMMLFTTSVEFWEHAQACPDFLNVIFKCTLQLCSGSISSLQTVNSCTCLTCGHPKNSTNHHQPSLQDQGSTGEWRLSITTTAAPLAQSAMPATSATSATSVPQGGTPLAAGMPLNDKRGRAAATASGANQNKLLCHAGKYSQYSCVGNQGGLQLWQNHTSHSQHHITNTTAH